VVDTSVHAVNDELSARVRSANNDRRVVPQQPRREKGRDSNSTPYPPHPCFRLCRLLSRRSATVVLCRLRFEVVVECHTARAERQRGLGDHQIRLERLLASRRECLTDTCRALRRRRGVAFGGYEY